MYCGYYGFSEKPFEVTPDPKFLFLSPSHRETLASLVYGIRERRGFIALVGEVGTGKTTLINAAIERLEGNTKVAYLSNTALNFNQMLLMVLQELRLIDPGQRLGKVEAIRMLNDFTIRHLSKGGNVVLIIDEAQNLDATSMENLRLLSNLETRKHKLIQIVLAGQPELDAKLGRPDLRQLAQRVSMRRSIASLKEEETCKYLRHRLAVADYRGSELFPKRAKKMIYEYSGGIPRKINILCDNALLIGFALKKKIIDIDCLAEAAEDLKWSPIDKASKGASSDAEPPSPQLAPKSSTPRFALATGITLAVALAFVFGITLGGSSLPFSVKVPFFSGPKAGTGSVRGSAPLVRSIIPTIPDPPPKLGVDDQTNPKGMTASSLGEVENPVQPERVAPPSTLEVTEFLSEQGIARPDKVAVTDKSEPVSGRVVVVERFDTLSGIIQRDYGRYEDKLLTEVLKENPEIRSPDRISIGQVIRLPEVKLEHNK